MSQIDPAQRTTRPRLTAASLKAAKPEAKPYELRSDNPRGLLLRVEPSGTQTFWVQTGRGQRRKLGDAKVLTLQQAADRARRVLVDPVAYEREKHASESLEEFLDKHYSPWAVQHLRTGKAIARRIRAAFGPKWCSMRLGDITQKGLADWRTARMKQGTADSTINRDLSALSSVLSKAVEWGALAANPAREIKPLRLSNEVVRYLTPDEEARLLAALRDRDTDMRARRDNNNEALKRHGYKPRPKLGDFADHMTPLVLLSMNTGMRQGEVFALRWEDVNLERGMLTVRGEVAKSGKTRHIRLNSGAVGVLATWKKVSGGKSGYVFPGNVKNKPLDNVKQGWASVLKLAEIENFRWHDLRHHFASKLVMRGVDLNTVRELLGHSDLKMTLRYAHLAPEHMADAVERISVGVPA